MMRLTKKKAKVVQSAIENWVEERLISQDQGQVLMGNYEVVGFDLKRLQNILSGSRSWQGVHR